MLKTASFSALSTVASRGVVFLGVLLLAYTLGPSDYGQFALIQTTALLFTSFCALSLGQMASKIVAEAATGDQKELQNAVSVAYGSAALMSLPLALAIAMLSGLLASQVGGNDALTLAYALASLLVLTGFATSVQSGILIALGLAREQAKVNFIAAPIALAILIAAGTAGDLLTAVAGYVLAQCVFVVAQEITLARHRKNSGIRLQRIGLRDQRFGVLWTLGVPSSAAGLFTVGATWFAMLMLSRGANGMAELGQFAVGNQVRMILLFGLGVVANAALPMLSRTRVSGDQIGRTAILRRSIAATLLGSTVLGGIIAAAAMYIVPLHLPAYSGALLPLSFLLLSVVATAPTSILMRKATSESQPGALIRGNAVYGLSLSAAAMVAYHWDGGAVGMALCFLAASLLQLATYIKYAKSSRPRTHL